MVQGLMDVLFNGYLTVSGLLRKFSIHKRKIVSKSILLGRERVRRGRG